MLVILASITLRHYISLALCNQGMRVVEEVRRLRLQELYQEHRSYTALNKLLGLNSRDSTLNQIATGAPNSKTGKPRSMGSDLARRLEAKAGKAEGWMDTDPQAAAGWPFPLVDQARWEALDDEARLHVQRGLNGLLAQYEDPSPDPLLHTGSTGSEKQFAVHEPRTPYKTR